ncbi:MAG: pilus assembly protein TadB [Propionibacteriaceae bacterium]|uniref:Type II secretion system (T2SS), protein F n=1 Tax=Propionibacterium ruminifibrarum TaxID=1962131 RepID=A0A375I010_9ACTN|nr:type II secretion system F family protein [Propionibacterium ruminifibrarum]MBE6477874.1 pilus assembly protein TadB [Propionibacteriaceae bacterium]SPF67945.1 Type II secretion system (T2SS), protein F [Propionibacterium ruminifibrarum]
MKILAAAVFALALGLLAGPSGARRLRRLDVSARSPGRHRAGHHRAGRLGALVVAACCAGAAVAMPWALAWSVIAATLCGTFGWVLWAHRREKQTLEQTESVAQACRVISSQLRIGQAPHRALETAAGECPVLEGVLGAQRVGGDVAEALSAAGERPGCSGLASLGRAWRLCERTGAPLSPVARRVAENVSAEAQTRAEISGELAVARLTGRLLCALPAAGIAMGFLAGGNPVGFLTGTAAGTICLAAAVVLACAGLVWTELLARRAQEAGS